MPVSRWQRAHVAEFAHSRRTRIGLAPVVPNLQMRTVDLFYLDSTMSKFLLRQPAACPPARPPACLPAVGGIPQKCEHSAGDRLFPRLGSPQRRVGRAPATIDDHHASLRPPALAPARACAHRLSWPESGPQGPHFEKMRASPP